jgi:hypothetical protein
VIDGIVLVLRERLDLAGERQAGLPRKALF